MKTEDRNILEEVYGNLVSGWMVVYTLLSKDMGVEMSTETRDRLTRAIGKIKEGYNLLAEDKIN